MKLMQKKPLVAAIIILVVLLVGSGIVLFLKSDKSEANSLEPLSRKVLEVVESEVRERKPPPTVAALNFAYVASAYDDGLAKDGQKGGMYAAHRMVDELYENEEAHEKLEALETTYNAKYENDNAPEAVRQVVDTYINRYKNDKHTLKWDGVIPTGDGKWVKTISADPLTPRAGEWQRWLVNKDITAPAPPVYGSAEDLAELAKVKQASAGRNGDDINKINFWGGTPGTNSPSGIWQDQIYSKIKSDLPKDSNKADKTYSHIQRYAALAMSDAFMECWKVKFIYWTARPDMRDPSIVTAMHDPNFPSYISGHSTISKAVADTLSVLVPGYSQQWEDWAVEARNSRFVAGIHFDADNRVGFDVGTEVAKQVVANASLAKSL